MSEHPRSPITSLLENLWAAIATLLAGTLIYLLTSLGQPVVAAIATASTKEFLLRLAALAGCGFGLAVAYILHLRYQRQQPLSRRYRFVATGGYYVDPKTGHGVCARCLADGVVIHLMEIDHPAHGAKMCNACQTTYRA